MSDPGAEEKPTEKSGSTQNPYDVPFPDRPEELHVLFVIWVDQQEDGLNVSSGLFPSVTRLGMDDTMKVFQSAGESPVEGEYIFRMSQLNGVQVLKVPEALAPTQQHALRLAVARTVRPGLDELQKLIRTLPKGQEVSKIALSMAITHFKKNLREAVRGYQRMELPDGYRVRAMPIPTPEARDFLADGVAFRIHEEDRIVEFHICVPSLQNSPYREFLQFNLAQHLDGAMKDLSSQEILYEVLARYQADILEATQVHTILRKSIGIRWDRVQDRAREILREEGLLPLEPEEAPQTRTHSQGDGHYIHDEFAALGEPTGEPVPLTINEIEGTPE